MEIDGFDWDSGNSEKCEKHGLPREIIEEFFCQRNIYVAPDIKHSGLETRFFAIGRISNERAVIIIFTIRNNKGKKLIGPISARFMHQKEVDKYEKEFGEN